MTSCPACRAELAADMRFCPECGRALGAESRDPVKLEINRNRLYMKDRSGFVELRVSDQANAASTVTLLLESSPPELLGSRGESQVRFGPGASRVARFPVDPKRSGELLFRIRLTWTGVGETLRYTTDDLVLRVNEPTATAQSLAITIDNSVSAGGDMSAISNRAQSDLGRQILDLARAGTGVDDLLDHSYPDRWQQVELVRDDTGLDELDALPDAAPAGEAQLRQALWEVLADGKVTDEERGRLDAIVRRHGIAPAEARRIIKEVRTQSQLRRDAEDCARVMGSDSKLQEYLGKAAPERVAEWRRSADLGAPESQWLLGECSRLGIGTPKDEAAGLRLLAKAAEAGYIPAILELAHMHAGHRDDSGQRVARNDAEALRLYRKAADLGDVRAMFFVGTMYQHGKGTAPYEAEADRWFRKAAELGHSLAILALSMRYDREKGLGIDDAEEVRLYRKAADSGHDWAMFSLAVHYANGKGTARDDTEAVRWFRKAAEAGVPGAMNWLGWMLEHGRSVRKDDADAVRWYRKAAELNNQDGMINLSRMYASGQGIAKDDAEAARWFRKAKEAGYVDAPPEPARKESDKAHAIQRTERVEPAPLLRRKEEGRTGTPHRPEHPHPTASPTAPKTPRNSEKP